MFLSPVFVSNYLFVLSLLRRRVGGAIPVSCRCAFAVCTTEVSNYRGQKRDVNHGRLCKRNNGTRLEQETEGSSPRGVSVP